MAATALYLNPLPPPYNLTHVERARLIASLPHPWRRALSSRVVDGLKDASALLLPSGRWADALVGEGGDDGGDYGEGDLDIALPNSPLTSTQEEPVEVMKDVAWNRIKSLAWEAVKVAEEGLKTALVATVVNRTINYSMSRYAPRDKNRRRLLMAAVVLAFITSRFRDRQHRTLTSGVTRGVAWTLLMYLNKLRSSYGY